MNGRVLLVGVLLVGVVSSTVLPKVYRKTTSIQLEKKQRHEPRLELIFNESFDALVEDMEAWIIENGLDPLQLPDQGFSFTITDLLGIEWTTELALTKGWMINLSQFERASSARLDLANCTLTVFTVDLRFPDITVDYDYTAKLWNIGPDGGLTASVVNVTVYLEINIDRDTQGLSLSQFYFTDVGSLTVDVTGLGLWQWVADGIIDFFTSIFEDSILSSAEDAAREILEEEIAKLTVSDVMGAITRRMNQ